MGRPKGETSERQAVSRETTPPPSPVRRRGATTVVTRKGGDRGRSTRADRRATALRWTTEGNTSGRMKTRRASAFCTTINQWCRGTDSRREQSPEDGLPGETRGLILLERRRVRSTSLLACGDSGRATVRRARVSSKERRISGRNEALKDGIPRAAWSATTGRPEGEQGVERGANPEDARCRRLGTVGSTGSFELATAEGTRSPREGQHRPPSRTRERAHDTGVVSGKHPVGE